jgi:hypothetical protein
MAFVGQSLSQEDARLSQEDASLCDGRVPLSQEDARTRQRDTSLSDARARIRLKDARQAHKDARVARTCARVGQRDGSLRPARWPPSFIDASLALMGATVSAGEPPDQEPRQVQCEAIARVNGRELRLRVEGFAVSYPVSSSEAKDAVQTAVPWLLDDKTSWKPVKGPGVALT